MLYDDDFIASLPENLSLALREIIKRFWDLDNNYNESDLALTEVYDDYIESFAVLLSICEAFNFNPPKKKILSDNKNENLEVIRDAFLGVQTELDEIVTKSIMDDTRRRLTAKFPSIFGYTFTEGDLSRIQTLINELRKEIFNATYISTDHKNRLLKKLESMQSELHKRVPSLDKLWGFMGDAGIALGKFGKDAKPIFDRAKEMVEIAWRTQARAEELPSGSPFPLLGSPEKQSSDD